LKEDRHQIKNVAGEPRYAKARANLERCLMNELRRTGDPRLIDEGRFFETPPMAGPLQESPPGLTNPRLN
jgi:N-sulfoglucosamine sulfohydrolase